MAEAPTWAVLYDVAVERDRQDRFVEEGRFPWNCSAVDAPTDYKLSVLVEEVGEVGKALLVATGDKGASGDLRTELVEVAAVATAWVEALDAQAREARATAPLGYADFGPPS